VYFHKLNFTNKILSFSKRSVYKIIDLFPRTINMKESI